MLSKEERRNKTEQDEATLSSTLTSTSALISSVAGYGLRSCILIFSSSESYLYLLLQAI